MNFWTEKLHVLPQLTGSPTFSAPIKIPEVIAVQAMQDIFVSDRVRNFGTEGGGRGRNVTCFTTVDYPTFSASVKIPG